MIDHIPGAMISSPFLLPAIYSFFEIRYHRPVRVICVLYEQRNLIMEGN
ncbi:MAG: hypothetical protein HLUCCO02_09550 [Idiomarinaceae bacterium HL-53]|nr:MAG: hypothetical protein HLUCCO02_09550 [Idiomarinaceae bacterium HL-53]